MSDTDSDKNEQLLVAGAKSFGLELSPHHTRAFSHYLSMLSFWSVRLNLTAIRNRDLVVRLHFIDSLSVVPLLSREGSLLDVGSGAGFPGIPITMMLIEKPVYLLEPRRKRATFLRHVVRELGLANAHVVEGRMECLPAASLPAMQETITRGFSDIPGFLKVSEKILAPEGTSIVMHGPKGTAVLDDLRACLPGYGFSEGRKIDLELPFGREQRTLLTFRKMKQARREA